MHVRKVCQQRILGSAAALMSVVIPRESLPAANDRWQWQWWGTLAASKSGALNLCATALEGSCILWFQGSVTDIDFPP